jgi:hypothetical protein
MRVFHGSDVYIDKIDLDKGKDLRDFGRGFYVTTVRKHAHGRALDLAQRNGTKPVVTEFEYYQALARNIGMSVKMFDGVSYEWLEFVIMNRNPNIEQPAHSYDIVEGAIADDWVTRQIERYQRGYISSELLIEKLTYREPTYQICFCTVESLATLERIDNDNIRFSIEDISDYIVESLLNESNISEEEAMRKFYLSDFYLQLTNAGSLLLDKPHEELYRLFKNEIAL